MPDVVAWLFAVGLIAWAGHMTFLIAKLLSTNKRIERHLDPSNKFGLVARTDVLSAWIKLLDGAVKEMSPEIYDRHAQRIKEAKERREDLSGD